MQDIGVPLLKVLVARALPPPLPALPPFLPPGWSAPPPCFLPPPPSPGREARTRPGRAFKCLDSPSPPPLLPSWPPAHWGGSRFFPASGNKCSLPAAEAEVGKHQRGHSVRDFTENCWLKMTSPHSGEAFSAPMLRGNLRRVGNRKIKS